MSGRGRGRGRGRGGSTAGRDQFNAAFAGMSKEDSRAVLESFSKPVKGSGMLYPPLDKAAEMPGPSAMEERIVFHTNQLLRDLADGIPDAEGRHGAPWRLESERKVVGIEIESYSDRYRRPGPPTGPSGTSRLDIDALHLHRDLFPPALWTEYFEGNTATEKKARALARAQRRKKVLEDGDEDDAEDEPSEEEDDDFDFEDEDEEDHQDYDANYFDNGEGDDDSGGEGGEDEGGRYDD